MRLHPGDRPLLYTDRLTEELRETELFGYFRVERLLEELSCRDRQVIVEGLRDAALHVGDRDRDDVLIMAALLAAG